MTTWNNIYSIINTYAKLENNIINLKNLNGGYIVDDYKNNNYVFILPYEFITISKDLEDSKLLEIFDAYLSDADTYDEVIQKYNLLPIKNDYSTVSVFEFISPLTLIAKNEKFNFDPNAYCFDFNDNDWKELEHKLTFNIATKKIDYAFAHINPDKIYDDSHCITIQWTVYTLPNKDDVTADDAKQYIINNLIQRFNILSLEISDNYYLNFGLTFFELR